MGIIISIQTFGGVAPRISPKRIPPNRAQTATNCKLLSGELRPWKTTSSVVTPSKVGTKKTIYRIGQDLTNEAQYWLHWLNDTDVARGPIAGDTSERTYFTENGQVPRYTTASLATTGGTDYPMSYYTLGVPSPGSTPSCSVSAGGTGTEESRAYVYTYLCGDQEGPPSAASNIVQVQAGETVTISNMGTGPGGSYNTTAKRIYRVVTTDTGSDYRFVKEVSAATTSTTDALTGAELGEALPSRDWDPPPSGMLGIISLWNGMMAGFETNRVWLSEPYQPHAWPYYKTLPFGVLGLGAFGQTIVAVTKGEPQIGIGADPSSFSFRKINLAQAGVSKRSIVSMPGGVAYAAADGIAYVDSSGARIITDEIMTREDWQALVPSSIAGYRLGDRYVGFYDTGSVQGGFIFDPSNPIASFTYIDTVATAGYNDPQREALYLVVSGNIVRWDNGGSNQSYTWKSKRFVHERPVNPGVAQIEASSFATSATFKLYADGTLMATKTVSSGEPFRLPDGYKAREFEIQIEGSVPVQAVYVAEVMEDLKGVPQQ